MKAFVDWAQHDWAPLCPLAQIAIRGRDATLTKVSPFFLQHGYNIDPLQLEVPAGADRRRYTAHERSDQEKAKSIVTKLRYLVELVQAYMAEAQQEQER
jgi:acetolactate synthase small subunit